jgi:hypothetical protein
MAHAQKPDFVFRRNGRVHLNRRGRQFSPLLAAEVYASAVVMLDTPCSEVVWRVLATHSIQQFPLHFLSPAPPCAIRFQMHYTYVRLLVLLVYILMGSFALLIWNSSTYKLRTINRDISACILTRLHAEQQNNRGWNLGEDKKFFWELRSS